MRMGISGGSSKTGDNPHFDAYSAAPLQRIAGCPGFRGGSIGSAPPSHLDSYLAVSRIGMAEAVMPPSRLF